MTKTNSAIGQARQTLRVERALELRAKGQTWAEIAKELDWKTPGGACNAVSKALQERAKLASETTIEAHRQGLLEQLDLMERIVWGIIEKRQPALHKGEWIVVTDQDGEEHWLTDDGPTMAAIDRLLRIQERRAKLLGTDAPQGINVGLTVHYQVNGIDVHEALT